MVDIWARATLPFLHRGVSLPFFPPFLAFFPLLLFSRHFNDFTPVWVWVWVWVWGLGLGLGLGLGFGFGLGFSGV